MDMQTAQELVGHAVQVKDVPGWGGILKRITPDGWAEIQQPTLDGRGRVDEVQVARLEVDPT